MVFLDWGLNSTPPTSASLSFWPWTTFTSIVVTLTTYMKYKDLIMSQLLSFCSGFLRLRTKLHSSNFCVFVLSTLNDLHKFLNNVVDDLDLPQPGQQRIRHHHRGNRYPGNEHRATPMWKFQVIGSLLAFLLGTLSKFVRLWSQKYTQTSTPLPSWWHSLVVTGLPGARSEISGPNF